MKVNKIGSPRSKKTLGELIPGDLFEYNGDLFIKTDRRDSILATDILCVVLYSGRTEYIKADTPIDDVVLIDIDDGILNYRVWRC